MNPIETITRALGCVLHTPQAEFYLGVGFPGFEGTPPTPRDKSRLFRMVRKATDTMQANRPSVRDGWEALFAQRSPATPGVRHLVSMLSRMERICHLAGHEWPDNEDERKRTIMEWGGMETIFHRWLLMAHEYFPDIPVPPTIPAGDPDQVADTIPANDVPDTTDQVADTIPANDVPDTTDQVANTVPSSTPDKLTNDTPDQVAVLVDRDRLAGCFKGGFKIADPATGLVPFDGFHRELVAKMPSYTTTDIGRVAHQVWQSRWAVSRVRSLTFAKWLREFCGICGATVPKDMAPTRYKTPTTATKFSAWLG